ncbi:IRS2 protein, partial [Polyodon spathula]|nr:IRS2 protein [Polyodon spathula]
MASPPTTGGHLISNVNINNNTIKKCGYLKKQKHGHKRFFVLKEHSEGLPARLEYYENEKKWKNRSAAKRAITLDSCLNINKRADAKHKHLIALYAKDEYFAVAAENEQEQESWYLALTDLMNEGKVYDGSASTSASSLVGTEETNYGLITPASAVYKEVWQVNLKSKGLGQSKNLTGVYRLCLSSRTIGFVKLNSEVPSVSLQLMNIRRCGHSDNFFFIEVGRSSSTGPGELWMQADDAVVAQNIHETILEAMKAMKELSEFRPRSKSQSSGTNPISVPTRRHLNNLPPSQTGLTRRSRTDSMAATSPANKLSSCRIRTASEGDGTMSRPVSVTGSPISPSTVRTHLRRSNTVTTGPSRVFSTNPLHHSKSMSMPVSQSPPSTTSPVSLSSSSGHGSALDTIQRPSSGSASVSGSPSDCGFMSCDECGSSPVDVRQYLGIRSNTPESIDDTPPYRENSDLYNYMTMARPTSYIRASREELLDLDKAYRKRTYSLTTPPQQRAASTVSSASLDEYTLMRATNASSNSGIHSASPKVTYSPYPEDYGDVEIGSHKSSSSNLGDDGYMPMTPGVTANSSRKEDYMPMSPTSISAPKQIINPRCHPQVNWNGHTTNSPSSCCLDDNGYMRMWCSSKLSVESSDGKLTNGDYMNMSPADHCVSLTPPDYFLSSYNSEHPKPSFAFNSLPRSYKTQVQKNGDTEQYVMMNLKNQMIVEESDCCTMLANLAVTNHLASSPVRQHLGHRGRNIRPTRLFLDTLKTLPSMNEYPLLPEPKSPGEYIKIDFSETTRYSPPLSTESLASSLGSTNGHRRSPLSDYMNTDLSSQSPKSGDDPVVSLSVMSALSCPCRSQPEDKYLKAQTVPVCLSSPVKDDYTEMTFVMANTPPQPISQKTESAQTTSPTDVVNRITLTDQVSGVEAFMLTGPSLDPDRGAKVIRADPQGRRRHSSETFSSTTTVTPVFPSFAHDPKRHSSASVENVSLRKSEGSEEEYGSPMCRETSAGFQNGLNYIALDLMDDSFGNCENIVRLKTANYLKGSMNGIDSSHYASIGFLKERTAATQG